MAKRKKDIVVNIKTVSFRSMVSIKQFQNIHVEASADVPAGADPEAVLEKVKYFVAEQLRKAKYGRAPEVAPRPGRFQDMLIDAIESGTARELGTVR